MLKNSNKLIVEMTEQDVMKKILVNGKYIKSVNQTPERCLAAVRQNGLALKFIDLEIQTTEMCFEAVKQDWRALQHCSATLVSNRMCVEAISQNGLALQYVPSKKKTDSISISAVYNKPLALEYVPNRFKTQEMCDKAVRSNWRAFLYLPESQITLDRCVEILEVILSRYDDLSKISDKDNDCIENILNFIPDIVRNDMKIILLERKLEKRVVEKKHFERSTNLFVVEESIRYRSEHQVNEFESFTAFYDYLCGNLENANLYDFDFKGIALKDFNIEGAYIRSVVLIEQNCYDDTFYTENVEDNTRNMELMITEKNEVVSENFTIHEANLGDGLNDKSRKMYYISDIHINHKLNKAFPKHATRLEIKTYIKLMVKKMTDTVTDKWNGSYLLISGDVSFNFAMSKMFYYELVKHWKPQKIVVVLGNHELWDYNRNGTGGSNSLESIVQQYRALFIELDISFCKMIC